MADDFKIHVDADRPATLNDGAGKLTDYATLQEAALAWHALPRNTRYGRRSKCSADPCKLPTRYPAYTLGRSQRVRAPVCVLGTFNAPSTDYFLPQRGLFDTVTLPRLKQLF
jgi:hypothetical protein